MSAALTVRAPAKINLNLGVGSIRPDGFHPLATVYQAIGLYDDVSVAEADEWSLAVGTHPRIDVSDVPADHTNIAMRAGRALTSFHGIDRRAAIRIEKGIPVAAGLAGGSADGAATLLALDRLWGLQTSDRDLLALAADLGSDVPFALVGGTALGSGRGEQVEPLEDNGSWWWVVVESEIGLSTPGVYREFDRLLGDRTATEKLMPELRSALVAGDPRWLAQQLSNDLSAAALSLRPDLAVVLADGRDCGALAGLMSGSGPTCLFLCSDARHAADVRLAMTERGYERVTACAAPVAGAHVVTYA